MAIYPIGIQSFEKLRTEGKLYVDKTAIIYRLIRESGYYFLSRPRRFGKSLLLSTLEAYYLGKRELFKGLELDRLTDDWETHPVLHLDLNNGEYRNMEDLNETLDFKLKEWEELYVGSSPETTLSLRFSNVIRKAYEKTGKKVVILVDEYDKPMLNAVDDEVLLEEFRSKLKTLYSNLKTMDQYIEFAMLTGVARFSKVSIFSDLNNLRDISFSDDYAAICGITDKEIDQYFKEGIDALKDKFEMKGNELRALLRRRYDGYHFAIEGKAVYNPFSLMRVFTERKLGSYWSDTGTPTFLVRQMLKEDWNLRNLSGYIIGETDLESAGLLSEDPIPSFYQTGYLTIAGYDRELRTYTLDYPNEEVKEAFLTFLLPYYLKGTTSGVEFSINKFLIDVKKGDIKGFMTRLAALIAKVPYSQERSTPESHFQNVVYLIFTLMGFYTSIEEHLSNGRTDLVVTTPQRIYIFEFKINRSARIALDQIISKGYADAYRSSGKEIYLIGANFNTGTRSLDDWLVEESD